MELFNEVKNSYYTCIQNIINQMILDNEEFDSKKIIDYLSESAFNIDENLLNVKGDKFLKELFEDNKNIKTVSLLKKYNDRFEPVFDEAIPSMLTTVELEYLKSILEDNSSKMILGEELYSKLTDKLSDVESLLWNEFCLFQGIRNNADSLMESGLANNIKIISEAIVKEKSLVYSSRTKGGVEYNNVTGIPYRILYSPRTGRFQLIILTDEERPILVNVNSITDLKLGDDYIDAQRRAVELIESKKKYDEPLVLEITDIYGAVERCFSLFSYYHKEAYFDEVAMKHILKIYYYDFDKSELVRDVLSLGDAVLVRSPEDIREAVISRVRKAYFA